MFYGVDYYPEHWPEDRWPLDARLMREAGFNIVRIAEFAWAKMEPTEGSYDFTWLDKAVDTLAAEGIKIVMCTPTSNPPKWLMDKHPEIYQKDAHKRVRGFGTRRHYCFNSPVYKEYTKRITKVLAERYGNHPAVVAWQMDNEFGNHDTVRCYCEDCLEAFKGWLKNKYVTIDALNREWGTIFWSQTYGSWDELILPWYTAAENGDRFAHNPGLLLDFYRFSSDSVNTYQDLQLTELRKYVKQPITHNMMGHYDQMDYFKCSENLDFASWDNYPMEQWGKEYYKIVAMAHDLIRGVKDKNFWVMEQKSGPCGWNAFDDTPRPGQIRLWVYQSIAHGAEGILFFRWRACTFGTEEYWYGILDHDGKPRRRYREAQQIGNELSKLSELIVDSKVVSDTAIIKSYDNLWSHQFQPHNRKFDYNGLLMNYYYALIDNNINIDMISERQDLSKYKIVFAPAFNLVTEEIACKFREYVRSGGTLVVTFRSGTRTWNNSMTVETLPGEFRVMAGIELEEFASLNSGRQVKVDGIMGEGTASIWCDVLKTTGAEVLARYAGEYFAGEPAVTVNSYGQGKVYYIGCDLDAESMKALVAEIAAKAGVEPVLANLPEGVEVVRKVKGDVNYLMLLNYNNASVTIDVPGVYTELITGIKSENRISLSPYGVALLAECI